MVEIFKREYWSKSKAFLLPLTKIPKTKDFDVTSYVKWNNFGLENYQLVVKIEYGHRYEEFLEFFKSALRTNNKAFITEIYDFEGFSILIFDISEWANDVKAFMKGKYSKLSDKAKELIKNYHTFYKGTQPNMNVSLYICLYPDEQQPILDNMSAIEYVSRHYDISIEELIKLGEICSKCEFEKETLVLELCQNVIPIKLE